MRPRPEPFKWIRFPSRLSVGLRVDVGADGETVQVSCKKPIKGLVFDVKGEEVAWSDQALDLVPGDPQTVVGRGLRGREVKVKFLGDCGT